MNAVRIGDFMISEFVDVEAYFRNTGLLDYRLEDLTDFSLDATQEKANITGRNGRIIGKKKKNKAVSGSGTSGVVSPGLFRTQTGGNITYGDALVKRVETKTCAGKGTTITTDSPAVGDAGNEIGIIQVFTDGGRRVAVFEQGTAASDDKFSYNPTTKTITLPNDDAIVSGMSIVYAYKRAVTATIMNDPADKFSEVRELWIHCFATDSCDNKYCADIYIPRADFKGDFTLDLGGDQTTHNFSFEALPDFCKTDGDNDLFKVFVYTEDTLTGSSNPSINLFASVPETRDVFDM